MASPCEFEHDSNFVETPSEDYFCPVTRSLLVEPQQTLCCGNHLSQEAVTRIQQDRKSCPLCKETLNTMPDKFFKRKVNELKVYCPNKSLGCEWVGEVRSVNCHLSQTSIEGECQFVTVACPYSCGDDLQRCQLEGHKANDCPNRPVTCQYCDHKATYIKVTDEHWSVCERYPVECPNMSLGCQWAGERGDLNEHLEEGECQFVAVACPYDCGDSFQRHQLEGHKVNDCPNRQFTCQYCGYEATYKKVISEHWSVCERYPVECPNKSLGCQWAGERGDLDKHLNEDLEEGECQFVTVACPSNCGDDFQRCQLEGHKVNDCPNRELPCQYCGYEATYNEVTKEHWPICKKYTLQCPNECGENSIERQNLPRHLDESCPQQVIKCEFRHAGCKFESQRLDMQTHLDENMTFHLAKVSRRNERQQQAIKQQQNQIDRLQFKTEQQQEAIKQQQSQIDALERKTEQQQHFIEQYNSQMHSMISTLNRVVGPTFFPPPEIQMDDFEQFKTADNGWFSPPFYSHIGGYKMCLVVDANGKESGAGTHISVWIHLIRGEHDHHLKWPFRGEITIQLLNQREDEGHWEKIVRFDDTADHDVARKVAWWQITTSGMGYGQFIAHTKLNTDDKEYLKNDCLKFRISKVVGVNI